MSNFSSSLKASSNELQKMALVIRLKNKTSIPLEVDSVRLETVISQSSDKVKSTLIQYGNKQLPLGEFFDVSGSADNDHEIVWEGDCGHVKLIGANLKFGRIRVEGNAGMHLGAEMQGGEIIVNGNASDWAGAEMHGGRIRILGDAGHLVGAVYRGGRRGMTGGEILVDGNVGNEVGHTMRRGLIAAGGRSGDAAGFNMIAGSLFLLGETGIRLGAGMRRGTIGLLHATNPVDMLPTFKFACVYRPVFLRFCLLYLKDLGFQVPSGWVDSEYQRYCGDFLEYGRGEILVRCDV